MEKIYLVYEQSHIFDWKVVKAFKEEQKTKDFCDEKNAINKPIVDDEYGFEEGVYHSYYSMDVE